MADKIDQLKIGSTSYDIDLPPDATPVVASLETTKLKVPTTSGSSTCGVGSDGQVIKSNGTTVYWASDSNSDTKVTQTISGSSNTSVRPILIGDYYGSGTPTAAQSFGTTTSSCYATHLAWVQPSTGEIYVNKQKVIHTGDIATTSGVGVVKSTTTGTQANKDYYVQVNTDGTMKVNVPWENTGFANPMTAAGDIIVGGTNGAATSLAKGSNGQVLKIVSGSPAWSADTDTNTTTSGLAFTNTPANVAIKDIILPRLEAITNQCLIVNVMNTHSSDTAPMVKFNGASDSTAAAITTINGATWNKTSNNLTAGLYTFFNTGSGWELTSLPWNYYFTPDYTSGVKIATGSGVGNLYVPTGTSSTTVAVGNHTHSQYFNNSGSYSLNAYDAYVNTELEIGSGWRFLSDGTVFNGNNWFNIAGDTGIQLGADVIISGADLYTQSAAADLVVQDGNVYANYFYAGSDIRLKENVADTSLNYNEILDSLHVIDFNYKSDKEKKLTVGLVAQELEAVLPEKYHDSFIHIKHQDENDYLNINETKLIYVALLGLKDQKKKIEELEARLIKLENK